MPRARSLRSTTVALLPCLLLAMGFLQACGREGSGGSAGAGGSSAARARLAGSGYDACPAGSQPAPPSGFDQRGHEGDFKSYVEGTLDFTADFHRSSRSILLRFAQSGIDTVGWATIEPEHCAHLLADGDFDGARVISRITSTADYEDGYTKLKFNKGVNYVIVKRDPSTTPPTFTIAVVQLGSTSAGLQVLPVVQQTLTRNRRPNSYQIPAANFRDSIYTYQVPITRTTMLGFTLLDNSQCGDQCCGFGGGDDGKGHGHGDSTHGDSMKNPARPESLRAKRPPARRGQA